METIANMYNDGVGEASCEKKKRGNEAKVTAAGVSSPKKKRTYPQKKKNTNGPAARKKQIELPTVGFVQLFYKKMNIN